MASFHDGDRVKIVGGKHRRKVGTIEETTPKMAYIRIDYAPRSELVLKRLLEHTTIPAPAHDPPPVPRPARNNRPRQQEQPLNANDNTSFEDELTDLLITRFQAMGLTEEQIIVRFQARAETMNARP